MAEAITEEMVISNNRFNDGCGSGNKRDTKLNEDETMETEAVVPCRKPSLPPISANKLMISQNEMRKIAVPSHRRRAMQDNWEKIMRPIIEQLQLNMRFNLKSKNIEIKVGKFTTEISALQRAADFVKAFMLGFDVDDALALIRLDELYLESFEITDVKPLKGDHLARAIGRIAGRQGKTKFTIENVTKTRIVLANEKIHLLGSFHNVKIARTAICNLILGSPPSKVYGNMRAIASRVVEK